MRIYLTATSETYPLSRKPAFIGINKANVSVCLYIAISKLILSSRGSGHDVLYTFQDKSKNGRLLQT